MASANDHEQQAADNEAFYQSLGGPGSTRTDWAITILFYTAVHDVQGFLRRKKVKPFPKGHKKRLQLLARDYPTLEPYYRSLKDQSEAARYDCVPFTGTDVKLAEFQLSEFRAEIARLEKI